ncbi:fatty-acid peroxygenase [Bacillus sp. OV322]|uniref:cytochrome P450 n=1 Tax=Bacillus sp. OV322 TaxID=1882764 RepID=UPI0008DF1BB4|nr:cytochrome P450 [Bacillus sp. OV322]SFC91477.1 fatty-acid peroxygenase [Bacillus sp. OV322]
MPNNGQLPRDSGLDHTLGLLKEGYSYILNKRYSMKSDIFETRLLGQKAICMGGAEAAEIFYDPEKFKREGAAPNRAKETLFGKNGVQGLDGQDHKHRKAMFMSLMSPDRISELTRIVTKQWELAAHSWEGMDEVLLYEEAQKIMCRTACHWAGVTVPEEEEKRLAADLAAMYESAAAAGPAHWKGRHSRNHAEKWIGELVEKVREGKVNPPEGTALHTFSWHKDLEGNLLDTETAAVEVLNILRPIVAISVFINFLVLAVHHYPDEKEKLRSDNENYAQMFVQEVRRFYPFFPFAAALVKKDFIWRDYKFEEGTLTLLDLYGTNHDPQIWDSPDVFNPGRFAGWESSPFSFIPQGGGDYFMGHRCAGEWVTVEVLKTSLDYLVNNLEYTVPAQDLSYSMVKMPSVPESKVVLSQVKRRL